MSLISRFHELLERYKGERKGKIVVEAANVLGMMTTAHKFVFSPEVMDFIQDHKEEYTDALAAAVAADHTELVFDPMLVETANNDGGRNFWLLQAKGPHTYRLRLAMIDRQTAVVTRMSFLVWIPSDGIPRVKSDAPEICRDSMAEGEPIGLQLEEMARHAVFYAQALHVRGIITRSAKPVPPKLDQARAKRGAPAITKDYVTVHIGYVTDRQGCRHDLSGPGYHVRMHLRRGHQRNQACGPDFREHRQIWIPATLVNYQPGAPIAQPDYLVVP